MSSGRLTVDSSPSCEFCMCSRDAKTGMHKGVADKDRMLLYFMQFADKNTLNGANVMGLKVRQRFRVVSEHFVLFRNIYMTCKRIVRS